MSWVRPMTVRSSTGSIQKAVDAAPPHPYSPTEDITCARAGWSIDREAQPEADAVVVGLAEHRLAHRRQVTPALEMIARGVGNGASTEEALSVEFAPSCQHLGEPVIVGDGGGEATTPRKHVRLRSERALGSAVVEERHASGGPFGHAERRERRLGVICDEPGRAVSVDLGVGHPERGVDHAEGIEDPRLEELVEGQPAEHLDEATTDIGRHAVAPLGAGREQQWRVRQPGADVGQAHA